MDEVSGIYRDGIFVSNQPVDWPEGTPVVVTRCCDKLGIDESQWPTTQQQLQEWLAWFDALEPLQLTPQEQEKCESARATARKENIEAMRKNWDELEKLY